MPVNQFHCSSRRTFLAGANEAGSAAGTL